MPTEAKGTARPTAPPLRRSLEWAVACAWCLCSAAGAARADVSLPSLGGSLQTYAIARMDADSPDQRPQARADLFLEQSLGGGFRWRVSGIGIWGGPSKHASFGTIDLDDTFQNVDPSLELDDAYLDYRGDAIDVRVGKQKFAWGRLDGIQPNDLLNPRRYADPFLTDEIESKIATPALALTWSLPRAWSAHLPEESRLTLAWVPVDVPWTFPVLDERWFAPAATVAGQVDVPEQGGPPCPCSARVTEVLRNVSPPARRFDNGNLGVRFSGRLGETDFALVYFDGYDPTPSFTTRVSATIPPQSGAGPVAVDATTVLEPAYLRFQSLGADAATPLGPFTVRAEGAWRFRRPYPFSLDALTSELVRDPRAVEALKNGVTLDVPAYAERDAVEWGVGADTVVEGFVPLVEMYQVILLHNDQPLLIRDVDTRLTLNLRKRWMADQLEAQFLVVWGIEAGYELMRMQLSYAFTDSIQLRVGLLGIQGDRDSLVGQYNRNSEAFFRVRYSF